MLSLRRKLKRVPMKTLKREDVYVFIDMYEEPDDYSLID